MEKNTSDNQIPNPVSLIYDMTKISPENLKLVISHNKFGGLCLKGDLHDKAISHFTKAIELSGNLAFTNVYQNLGNAYAQKNNIEEAIKCYHTVIEYSPFNPANKEKIKDENIYNGLINSKEAYVDAYTNLGRDHVFFLIILLSCHAFKIGSNRKSVDLLSKSYRTGFRKSCCIC